MKKTLFPILTGILTFLATILLLGTHTVSADTNVVHLPNATSYDITNAPENTLIEINDDTITRSSHTAWVELKGSSENVWVHISVSKGNQITVKLADGLNIKPGSSSPAGTGHSGDTLGHSRAGIYIDETEHAGGTVILMSEKGARITVDSYKAYFWGNVPAIMKNDSKTSLVFATEDPSDPGTIRACPTSAAIDYAVGIGAFGYGILGNATSEYTVGKMDFQSGNIEAEGYFHAAGIGANDYSHIGDIYFTGAHVVAKSGNSRSQHTTVGAAGIGTSYRGNIDLISISGGYVEAWGQGSRKDSLGYPLMRILDTCGAGIGGGVLSHIKEINISGGTVVAYGGTCATAESSYVSGCGIGTTVQLAESHINTCDKIVITGGNITAVGGDRTCGIGGCVGEILISPATPTTELKINAYIDGRRDRSGNRRVLGCGIGIANNVSHKDFSQYPGNITITGGDITATGGDLSAFDDDYMGAGIGPNYYGRVNSINISGGTINAIGGKNSPGIGGMNKTELFSSRCIVNSIHISGGTITATKASTNGFNVPVSGIGGYKNDNGDRTDIRITGGSIISNGSDYAIGYDAAGQPKNDAGETVYGTKFLYDPDPGEWVKVNSFVSDRELPYDYGLKDVYIKKGLDYESSNDITEFWLPRSGSSGYKVSVDTDDRIYGSFDPEKVEAGDKTTLAAYTDIKYVNPIEDRLYTGFGVYGRTNLSIDPTPDPIPGYRLNGYFDENDHDIAYGEFGMSNPRLVSSTHYTDAYGKWKAVGKRLTLNMFLEHMEYTVSYDPNKPDRASHDVTGSMEDSTFPISGTSTLRKNTYSLPGWQFDGWNTSPDGSGTAYGDEGDISYGTANNVTLYAQWSPKKYIVEYDPDGGTGSSYTQEFEYDTPEALDPNGFSYPGHSFVGWRTDAFGSFYRDREIVRNLCSLATNGTPQGYTLYADWNDVDSIILILLDDGVPVKNPSADCITLENGATTFTNEFSKFGAGYKADNLPPGTYTVVFSGALSAYEPREYVAFTSGQTNTYVWDYHSVTLESGDHCTTHFSDDSVQKEHLAPGTNLQVVTSTDTGYKFKKYTCSGTAPTWGGSATTADQTITVNGTVRIKSEAEPVSYHVEYEKNRPSDASHDVEGSMSVESFVYDVEKKLTKNTYTLEGWSFTGWNTAEDGSGNNYADMETVLALTGVDGDTVRLYAQWNRDYYRVYFVAPDATSGHMDPQLFGYDEQPKELDLNAYERTDWRFTGWNTRPYGGGTAYENGQIVSDLTTGKSISLFAQWEHDYYTVAFNKNNANATGIMQDEHVWTNCGFELALCDYSLKDYEFESWNTSPDGSGTRYEDGQTLNNAAAKGDTITLYAQWKYSPQPTPTPAPGPGPNPDPTPTPTPAPDKRDHDDRDKSSDSDHHESGSSSGSGASGSAYNPNALEGQFLINGVPYYGAKLGKQKQGPFATFMFNLGRPYGWKDAFTFNLSIDGKTDYTVKKGKLVLFIPQEYRKDNRIFALTGLDRFGFVHVFEDTDKSKDTLTVNLDFGGYAFDLVYFDPVIKK